MKLIQKIIRKIFRRNLKKLILISLILFTISRLYFSTDDNINSSSKIKYRQANELSPFHLIDKKINYLQNKNKPFIYNSVWNKLTNFKNYYLNNDVYYTSESEVNLLLNWGNQEIVEQCEYLINNIYRLTPEWDNHKSIKFYGYDPIDDYLASSTIENLRIYSHCFLKHDVTPINIWGKGTTKSGDSSFPTELIKNAVDFQSRMFPFLLDSTSDHLETQYMYPTILNVNKNETIEYPTKLLEISPIKFNMNFWPNYSKLLSGKGISMTMKSSDLMMFEKLINVLDFQDNRLPIQIVTKGNNELNYENFINELNEFLVKKNSNQTISIVNVESILRNDYIEQHLNYFFNKWIAVLFSTFEETIFLDVDSIPFVNLNNFYFDNQNNDDEYQENLDFNDYKETGILMYKDRMLVNENTFQYCMDMLEHIEPSNQEVSLIDTNLVFNSTVPVLPGTESYDNLNDNDKEIWNIYNDFFNKQLLHHIDSGLVVINKKSKTNSLLMSFMVNFSPEKSWPNQKNSLSP